MPQLVESCGTVSYTHLDVYKRQVLSFAVPKDINYSDSAGLVNLFAVNSSKGQPVHGSSDRFLVGG